MAVKVSVVIPCLNEEEGIASCVEKAKGALEKIGCSYEIVISDNGSEDRSREIAASLGARVVKEPIKGYGSAYISGIKASRGDFIVMADGDDTYDFGEIGKFIKPLEEGYDFVIGSRFNGRILPGAMSWSHRYIGNPILSSILRLFFHTKVSDAHCGYRSLTRDAFKRMQLKTLGMEFASEMIVNDLKRKLKIKEIPIQYYPRKGKSKLASFEDAWRHTRFMLFYAPTYLYLLPGSFVLGAGLVLVAGLSFGPVRILGRLLDFHFNILGTVLSILGFQILTLGIFSRSFSYLNEFDKFDKKIERFLINFHLEKGILLGSSLFIIGFLIFLYILIKWISINFGGLFEIRKALLATTLSVIGVQTVFSSFFLSFLIMEKNPQA